MPAALHWRIAMAIEMAIKHCVIFIFDVCCFACCPDSRWGYMAHAVTQLWCPEASGIALDMLHWGVCAPLHPHI
jgi:hypothetical protein